MLPEDDLLLLLHNPRCSKSRELKAALDELGIVYEVRRYLEQPLVRSELVELERRLGRPLGAVLRTKESAYAEAGLSPRASSAEVLAALLALLPSKG